ncbi:MAG: hypothetical protein WCV56_01180 [Candidatus Omnitrophota bacterium]
MESVIKIFRIGCKSQEVIYIMGLLELYKRERGLTEEDMLIIEQQLKLPETRKVWKEEFDCDEEELDSAMGWFRYRRRLYVHLKRDGKKVRKAIFEEVDKPEETQENPEEKNN